MTDAVDLNSNLMLMEKTEPIIQVKDLYKAYGPVKAVDGISFEVFRGEIFGILGPNGAGKTTTLEIIETLRTQDQGNVRVKGLECQNNTQKIKKMIGVNIKMLITNT